VHIEFQFSPVVSTIFYTDCVKETHWMKIKGRVSEMRKADQYIHIIKLFSTMCTQTISLPQTQITFSLARKIP